jgi:COMPASS component SWD3
MQHRNIDAVVHCTSRCSQCAESLHANAPPCHLVQTQGRCVHSYEGHTSYVFCCNFDTKGSAMLVSGSFDEHVKVWDVRHGKQVRTLASHSDPVTAADFNLDGNCIVSGSHDGLIRIWDTTTGNCLKTIFAEGNPPVRYYFQCSLLC